MLIKLFSFHLLTRKKVLSQFIPKSLKDEIENKTHIIPNGVDDFWLKNKNNPKTKVKMTLKFCMLET